MTINHGMFSSYGTYAYDDNTDEAWANDVTDTLDDKISKETTSTQTISSAIVISGTATLGSLSGILKASSGLVSGSADTDDLPEGTNLYYDEALVDDRVKSYFLIKDDLDIYEQSNPSTTPYSMSGTDTTQSYWEFDSTGSSRLRRKTTIIIPLGITKLNMIVYASSGGGTPIMALYTSLNGAGISQLGATHTTSTTLTRYVSTVSLTVAAKDIVRILVHSNSGVTNLRVYGIEIELTD